MRGEESKKSEQRCVMQVDTYNKSEGIAIKDAMNMLSKKNITQVWQLHGGGGGATSCAAETATNARSIVKYIL